MIVISKNQGNEKGDVKVKSFWQTENFMNNTDNLEISNHLSETHSDPL